MLNVGIFNQSGLHSSLKLQHLACSQCYNSSRRGESRARFRARLAGRGAFTGAFGAESVVCLRVRFEPREGFVQGGVRGEHGGELQGVEKEASSSSKRELISGASSTCSTTEEHRQYQSNEFTRMQS
eukprot:344005-Pyramimonas_sp.AAC.2